MIALITKPQLAVVARESISPTDAFADWVIQAASLVVMETAMHLDWTAGTAPDMAKLICMKLAVRTYLNPDAVISDTIGPISETKVADYARTLELTKQEIASLVALQGDGDGPGLSSGLWVQPTNGGLPMYPVLIPDNSPVNDWMIPMISETDVFAYPIDDPMPAPHVLTED